MKKTKIIYWIFTILVIGFLGVGSIFDVISAPEAVAHVTRIGYPAYLVPFLGVAKILGIVAILIPGFPRLKEWAYAGLFYDLLGATFSHIAFGDTIADWAPMLIGFAVLFGSYIYYHKLRKLSEPA
jgi:hypothetical protein